MRQLWRSCSHVSRMVACGEGQVNEVVMQNEYALRLKEVSMNERIRELTDKFSAEIEADRTKFDQLLQEKNELEMSAEDTARRTEERHQVLVTRFPSAVLI